VQMKMTAFERLLFSFLVLLIAPLAISIKIPYKGILVDWSLKLFHQDVNVMDVASILASTGETPVILRERLNDLSDHGIDNHDSSGLSLVLDYGCNHEACQVVKDSQECVDLVEDAENIKKLVLRREDDLTWRIDCRLFLKVELPVEVGGVPGARIADDGRSDRGNLETGLGEESMTTTQKTIVVPNVKTVTIPTLTVVSSSISSNDTKEHNKTMAECNELAAKDFQTFYTECCLGMMTKKASLSDTRCLLSNVYQTMKAKEITTPKPVIRNPFDTDISNLAKVLDEDNGNDTSKVLFQEISGEMDGWKSKYFTILGFFLVFLLLFLIIIAVLVYRLRKNKTVSPPASPGAASLGVPPPQRSRGYSALEDDQDEDRAPLTPATQQAQSFQY